jgi:hypothetical protein
MRMMLYLMRIPSSLNVYSQEHNISMHDNPSITNVHWLPLARIIKIPINDLQCVQQVGTFGPQAMLLNYAYLVFKLDALKITLEFRI